MKILSLPKDDRPRERLEKNGAAALSNAELLAIILRTGSKTENIIEISSKILKKYDLKKLSRIRVNAIKKETGIGQAKACQIIACFELARRLKNCSSRNLPIISSAKDVVDIVQDELSCLNKEHLLGIYIDARKRMLKKEIIFVGSLDSNIIHPREVFNIAINENAAAVILVHNHPSNDPEPSDEDIEATKQIVEAGKIMGIEVLDHIIVTDKKYFSMMEKGIL